MQEYQSYLERVRTQEGSSRCIELFERSCRQSRMRGAALINDKGVTFPTLYLLCTSIQPRQQFLNLNQRNRQLIHILTEMEKDETGNGKIPLLAKKHRMTQSSLKWAVKTGYQFDGDDNYDYAIDTFVSVLLITYKDKDVLPYAEQLIFARSRAEKGIHDLVWAYFHLHDMQVLKRMAEHLRASDPLEAKLAEELLDTEHICNNCEDSQSRYDTYLKWLEENDPYLFFTEENLFFSRKPAICRVDKERKYLQKRLSNYERQPLQNLKQQEKDWLGEFQMLDTRDREAVSCLSCSIRRKTPHEWVQWMGRPMREKVENARAEKGGRV